MEFENWLLELPHLFLKDFKNKCGWGCLASTDCYLKNKQADYCSRVIKISAKDISANFISKVKESFARAFAPSFASALA